MKPFEHFRESSELIHRYGQLSAETGDDCNLNAVVVLPTGYGVPLTIATSELLFGVDRQAYRLAANVCREAAAIQKFTPNHGESDYPALTERRNIDKPMQRHGFLQAIARVDRVFRDTPAGLIVDYIGIVQNLKSALGQYSRQDRKHAGIDEAEAVAVMLEKYGDREGHVSRARLPGGPGGLPARTPYLARWRDRVGPRLCSSRRPPKNRTRRAKRARVDEQGLSQQGISSYDGLAQNESTVEVIGNDHLRVIAHELLSSLKSNASVDWQHRESTRVRMRSSAFSANTATRRTFRTMPCRPSCYWRR